MWSLGVVWLLAACSSAAAPLTPKPTTNAETAAIPLPASEETLVAKLPPIDLPQATLQSYLATLPALPALAATAVPIPHLPSSAGEYQVMLTFPAALANIR